MFCSEERNEYCVWPNDSRMTLILWPRESVSEVLRYFRCCVGCSFFFFRFSRIMDDPSVWGGRKREGYVSSDVPTRRFSRMSTCDKFDCVSGNRGQDQAGT